MIIFLFILNFFAVSKTVYVSEAISVTSKFEDQSYSGNQLIGKPNNFVEYGTSLSAWRPKDEFSMKGEELFVKFEEELNAKRLAVFQNFNPGAISEVIVYNSDTSKSKKNIFF